MQFEVGDISAYEQRRNIIFFIKNAHFYGLSYFGWLPFHETWKLQNKSINLAKNFSERKDIDFCCDQMMKAPFDS